MTATAPRLKPTRRLLCRCGSLATMTCDERGCSAVACESHIKRSGGKDYCGRHRVAAAVSEHKRRRS